MLAGVEKFWGYHSFLGNGIPFFVLIYLAFSTSFGSTTIPIYHFTFQRLQIAKQQLSAEGLQDATMVHTHALGGAAA
jgi:hypothetical protein